MFYKPTAHVTFNKFEKKNTEGEVIGVESYPTMEVNDVEEVKFWYAANNPIMEVERFSIYDTPSEYAFCMILQYDQRNIGIFYDRNPGV
jgi:hypothetical protein